jgi:CRISPR-associated endonuclease Csn1
MLRVFARPGALTDRLRKAFGLQWIKKNEKGERIRDDRHHALDAIIVAATTESLLNRATRQIQKKEREGRPFELTESNYPPSFLGGVSRLQARVSRIV